MCICSCVWREYSQLYSAIYYLYESCFGVFNCCWKAFVPFWGEFVRDMNCVEACAFVYHQWMIIFCRYLVSLCSLLDPHSPSLSISYRHRPQPLRLYSQYPRIAVTTITTTTSPYPIRNHSIITISVPLVEKLYMALCVLLCLYDADG